MDWLTDPQIYISLVTLTVLEIVLGVDNIVFISILAGKLPREQQHRARQTGLALALLTRIALLLSLTWVMSLRRELFSLFGTGVTGRDLILLLGGLFLIWKSTREIHEKLEGEDGEASAKVAPKFSAVIVQIMLLDIVFSLDSVITAVGMVKQVGVMIAAVVIAVGFMLLFAKHIAGFIDRHPTLKVLALSFLMMIGLLLVAEGFHHEIPKGYVYFAMAFSVGVEALNIRMRSKRAQAVALHQPYR
ncbi:MAG: TerC family protein [Verrucomicrobia bacterium]|nr:TerC family protein [Verrucomicrobiota bacterium]